MFPEKLISEKYNNLLKIKEEINDIVFQYVLEKLEDIPFVIESYDGYLRSEFTDEEFNEEFINLYKCLEKYEIKCFFREIIEKNVTIRFGINNFYGLVIIIFAEYPTEKDVYNMHRFIKEHRIKIVKEKEE